MAKNECLSAARAGKIQRRTKPVRQIAEAATYTVHDPATGATHEGTLKTVIALCPKVKTSTLKRRLDAGERDLKQLRRPPADPHGKRRTYRR
jgi:hypothetical protein